MGGLLSVVVSVYSEEKALEEFYRETTRVLRQTGWNYKLLFVNSGSRDGGQDILDRLAASDSGVKVISLSRNFGHEVATMAGLDYSRGGSIICMDADLQYPPECIPDILTKLKEGYQVTNMIHIRNRAAGLAENTTSPDFYWLISRVSDMHSEINVSDFSAVSCRAAQMLEDSYREKARFPRDYVQNVGFRKTAIEYEARTQVAGESKYSVKKLFAFLIDIILCFSNISLKLGIYAGVFLVLLGFAVMMRILCTRKGVPSGYATIVVLTYFMFAMMLVITGTVDECIAILFTELKDRPIYIVDQMENTNQGGDVDQTVSITDRTENRNQTKNAHQKKVII